MTLPRFSNSNLTDRLDEKKLFTIFHCALVLCLALAACEGPRNGSINTDETKKQQPVGGIYYLDQGWTDEQRQMYYHMTQGTRILPYDWFLALEMAGSDKLFRSDASMARFRIIPNKNTTNNPDQLPVGFAKTVLGPSGGTWVGFACAACHTGEITYQGKRIRIDGGPAMLDTLRFPEAMVRALGATLQDKEKWARFAKAVLKSENPAPQAANPNNSQVVCERA